MADYLSVTREHLLIAAEWLLDKKEHLLLNIDRLLATSESPKTKACRRDAFTMSSAISPLGCNRMPSLRERALHI